MQLIRLYKAEIILLLITFAWGLSFPLLKISLGFISSSLLLSIRFSLTVIVFYFAFRKRLNFSDFGLWYKGVYLGLFLFLGFAFQTLGLKFTTASKSAFITGTALVIIPFAQFLILKIKPKFENIAGAFIVLIGLYILSESHFIKPNTGDILTFACAFFFAIHIVLLNKYSTEYNFYYLAYGQFVTTTLLSLILLVMFEITGIEKIQFEANSTLIVTLLYVSLVSTFLSIVLITRYQRETTPVRAGIIYSMESVFAVFFAYILLNEILNFNQFIGALLMILGLLVSEFYGLLKTKSQNGNQS